MASKKNVPLIGGKEQIDTVVCRPAKSQNYIE